MCPPKLRLADPPVLGAVEQGAVGLELPHPVRGFLRVQFGHPPVVEELAAAHGVGEMHLPAVLGVRVAHRGRAAALGHHGVGLAEQRLGHDGHPQAAFPGLDDRTQPRATGADHDDVVGVPFDLGSLRSCDELWLGNSVAGSRLSANESEVRDGATGHQHHVEVGEHQGAQRDPGVQLVPGVQPADLWSRSSTAQDVWRSA